MTSEAGVRLERGQLAVWRPERGQKRLDCNPHVKKDKPWKFHMDQTTNGQMTALKLNILTIWGCVCSGFKHSEDAVVNSSSHSAICYPICMKLSGFVYFDMRITVQPFLTSFRPPDASWPHSSLTPASEVIMLKMKIVKLLILEHPIKKNFGFLMFSSLWWRLFENLRLPVFGLQTSS